MFTYYSLVNNLPFFFHNEFDFVCCNFRTVHLNRNSILKDTYSN